MHLQVHLFFHTLLPFQGLSSEVGHHGVPPLITLLFHAVISEPTVLLRLDVPITVRHVRRADAIRAVLAVKELELRIVGQALPLEPGEVAFPPGVHLDGYLNNN